MWYVDGGTGKTTYSSSRLQISVEEIRYLVIPVSARSAPNCPKLWIHPLLLTLVRIPSRSQGSEGWLSNPSTRGTWYDMSPLPQLYLRS